jgi:hypothetical protein
MASYEIELHNTNDLAGQGGGDGDDSIIFLITEPDDTKNALILIVRNSSGSDIILFPFSATAVFRFYLDQLLPVSVIARITVSCPGWISVVDPLDPRCLILSPIVNVTINAGDKLVFKIGNIYFSEEELQGLEPKLKDAVFMAPEPYTISLVAQPRKVCLKPWPERPKPLLHFQAVIAAVPESEQWNVKRNDQMVYDKDKNNNQVLSNPSQYEQNRTRLAFRLINQDRDNALRLTPDSSFTVSFLTGDGAGEIAGGKDLVKNVTLKELGSSKKLGTSDWAISQATDTSSPEWTLKPVREITLDSCEGSYTFLIDAVLPNANPGDPSSVCETEMYIFYSKVVAQDGKSAYDDGYLSVSIEKIWPQVKVTSFDVKPDQVLYHPLTSVTLTWSVVGASLLTLSYNDLDGSAMNPIVDADDHLVVTPPVSVVANTTTYTLMNLGKELDQRSLTVEGIGGYFAGKQLVRKGPATCPFLYPHPLSLNSTTVELKADGSAVVTSNLSCDSKSTDYQVTSRWSVKASQDYVTLSIGTPYTAKPYQWGIDAPTGEGDDQYDIWLGTDNSSDELGLTNSSTVLELTGPWTAITTGAFEALSQNQIGVDNLWAVPVTKAGDTWAFGSAE